MDLQWKAKWIWTQGDPRPRNYHLCVRKTFPAPTERDRAVLHITADSRYRAYLNGEWLGDGPARSWRDLQQFDTYDVAGLLCDGQNALAILVHHFGESTFHYDIGRAGLLAQVQCSHAASSGSMEVIAATDSTWRTRHNEAFERRTLRISCQMPFEEHYNANHEPARWTQPDYDDSNWDTAIELGPVGMAPWKQLEPRTIPFLTREPVYPVNLPEMRLANPPNIDSSFHLKPYVYPSDRSSNPRIVDAVAATVIHSDSPQEIILLPAQAVNASAICLNGRELAVEASELWHAPVHVRKGRLRKGENLLTIRMASLSHVFDVSLCGVTAKPVTLRSPSGQGAWMVFTGAIHDGRAPAGPESGTAGWERDAHLDDIARCASPEAIRHHLSEGTEVDFHDMADASVFNLTAWAVQAPGKLCVEGPECCLTDQADVATIECPAGGDTELLLDFGRELIGYIEFDVEAEAGTVLDGNMFEGIQDIGRHYTLGNLNSFRYVATGGRQRFRSFQRRGLRYLTLTLRNHTHPVKIHWVRCLLSTYPSVERGSFRCSDPMLTKIWETGRYTLRMCSEDTFTDCPTYEQTYWVGDARNEALVNYAAYGDEPLTARCVVLPVHSLQRSVLTESQVPSGWQNVLTAWSLLWVLMVEEHFQWSGNIRTLRQAYSGVIGNMRSCHRMLDKRGLLSIDAWNMFDWAPQDINSRVVAHNQMFLAGALASAERLATVLNRSGDARFCREMRSKLIRSINRHLWDDKRKAYVDSIHDDGTPSTTISQQTNSLAVLYGVAGRDRAEQIAKMTVRPPARAVKVGSPFAMFYILETLAHIGRHDELIGIVRDRWGAMIDAGATTFWETFPGWEGGWVSRSLCHAWSAAPTWFLSRYQLGVEPLEPGFAKAAVRPVPAGLEWCEGSFPTPHGSIGVSWKNERDAFSIAVEPPAEVETEIQLPVPPAEFPVLRVDGKSAQAAGTKASKAGNLWTIRAPRGRAVRVEARRKK